MNREYLSQITNSNLTKLLLKDENIPVLKDVLNSRIHEFRHLEKLNEAGKLDLGNYVKPGELEDLLLHVKKNVDEFLGVSNIKPPKIKYHNLLSYQSMMSLSGYAASGYFVVSAVASNGSELERLCAGLMGTVILGASSIMHLIYCMDSCYNKITKTIDVKKNNKASLVTTIAHEYSHHVQRGKLPPFSSKYEIFREGHAIGVERYIAEMYSERGNNPAFLYEASKRRLYQMTQAYFWMCTRLGKSVNANLVKKAESLREKISPRESGRKPNPHAFGTALFSIYEQKHSKGIYKDMLHCNFEFH